MRISQKIIVLALGSLCVYATVDSQPLYRLSVIEASNYQSCSRVGVGGGVAGYIRVDGQTRGFRYRNGVTAVLEPLPGGRHCIAHSVNSSNVAVGESATADGHTHAVMWVKGVPQDLGYIEQNFSEATFVNEQGVVIGRHRSKRWDGREYPIHAFIFKNGVMRSIPAWRAVPMTVNRHDTVVGYSDGSDTGDYPFIWTEENGLRGFGQGSGQAWDINDWGVVVGYFDNRGPFIWQNGRHKFLGRFFPKRITNSGLMAGHDGNLRDYAIHKGGYSYTISSRVVNLGNWVIDYFLDMSRDGYIIVNGHTSDGSQRDATLLLTPMFFWE